GVLPRPPGCSGPVRGGSLPAPARAAVPHARAWWRQMRPRYDDRAHRSRRAPSGRLLYRTPPGTREPVSAARRAPHERMSVHLPHRVLRVALRADTDARTCSPDAGILRYLRPPLVILHPSRAQDDEL